MEARAQARFVRVTPTKARRVVDVIRGMDALEAMALLRFTPQGAAEPVRKVVESAVANADNLDGTPADRLVVTKAYVDEGPTMRRYRPRAFGRANRINKRTSHITVIVDEKESAVASGSKGGTR